ncbi:MAG: DEAD/DEAH box helicase [Candidatus Cloacimonas sp. SDB]|nr:MAG: DEAD/DEAH box helicase [Candidatus Cloacimonas sp. SDB]
MKKITESAIEELAIQLLQGQKYDYIFGPDIAPDGLIAERSAYSDVILRDRLAHAVKILNPAIPADSRLQAMRELENIHSPDLLYNNEKFHNFLVNGVDVVFQKDGDLRGDKVWLIDFNEPEKNEFLIVNQFTVIENNNNKRPDLVLFINGLPLVIIELKNPTDERATIRSAFNQIETYKAMIPVLFTYNALNIISDGLEARVGSLSAGFQRFTTWKSKDGSREESGNISQLEVLVEGLLNKRTLLDIIKHFTVFEKSREEDAETGQISVSNLKKVAAYHQYYAVNKAVTSTIKAANPGGSRKGGVIWHTQGSGKSLSMVFYTGKLVLALDNPTIVVITDRNDLDDQLFDTFANCKQLLRQVPVQAESRLNLREKLQVASGGIVFTTIHKFSPEEGESFYPLLSDRRNIIVIADEAHRSQYGFQAREVDIKDEAGKIIGKQTQYGFAKYVRDALPNATFIGFSGTPIEFTDRNTPAVFGNYIDIYDIHQAEQDDFTVKIYYESRLAVVELPEQGKKLIKDLDEELDKEDLTITQQAKAKWTKLEAIIGSNARIKTIVTDMLGHYEQRQKVFAGKAMFVAISRRVADKVFAEIIARNPSWYDPVLKKGKIKVVMTAASSEGPKLARHHMTKQQRRQIAARFKDPEDELKMVIVCDMWLTGFDVPCLHTMYIDKPMKGHTLMQAIARVNRVYLDKPGGLIVDYIGFAAELKKAMQVYSGSGGKGSPVNMQQQAVELMLEKLEVAQQFYQGFDYRNYFTAHTAEKLSIILQAEEHILSLDNGKTRYLNVIAALSKVFALAIPHPEALRIKEEVSFFQAVKARLVKFEPEVNGRSSDEIDTAIREVIDTAIVSDRVVDIFQAAGLEKPEISILSDEFLAEVQGMKRKNLAFELLKKLLGEEIQARQRKNVIQSKKLMEMLDEAIRRYKNKLITAAEVIEELIKLAQQIKQEDQRVEEMGLSMEELAFYDALANNESARNVMGDEKLRDLAAILVERIRKNASIDWNLKESVRARLKVMIKRLLRKYGYPPDKQAIATETVLQQAKLFTEEWLNSDN